jgi:dienelactone hydrolase
MRFALAALALIAAASTAPAAEVIDVGEGDAALNAVLYRPQGSGPFPVIVGLHGCAGLLSPNGQIVRRFADWGERLSRQGLAVLFVDSFTPRGLGSQCGVRERKVRSDRERVADASAVRRWLQGQGWANKNRVSLLGWSSGAVASLWAVRPRIIPRDGMPDFRSAAVFYPGCRRLSTAAWSARIPTLILMGRADDWASASVCEQMVAGARGRSAQASIVVYPGAYHEFDRPDYPVRVVTGLANSADGSGRAHVGTNEAARADAIMRVSEWLSR